MRPVGGLLDIYQRLLECYGEQHWWPAESPFEVMVGAVLTQNTAWNNVELALAALRRADCLSPNAILKLTTAELEDYIRPAGFFRQKGATLRHLIEATGGVPHHFSERPVDDLRRELLGLRGIGPETADAILLYAGGRATFVVDAYTRRICHRLGLVTETIGYEALRRLFMEHLPHDPRLFNEYHALLVVHAKTRCRKQRPVCDDCPLYDSCNPAQRPT